MKASARTYTVAQKLIWNVSTVSVEERWLYLMFGCNSSIQNPISRTSYLSYTYQQLEGLLPSILLGRWTSSTKMPNLLVYHLIRTDSGDACSLIVTSDRLIVDSDDSPPRRQFSWNAVWKDTAARSRHSGTSERTRRPVDDWETRSRISQGEGFTHDITGYWLTLPSLERRRGSQLVSRWII